LRKGAEFRLKNLLDRIAEELKKISNESHTTHTREYDLKKPVCEQQETIKEEGKLPPT